MADLKVSTNPLSRLSRRQRRLLILSIIGMFGLLYAVIPELSVFGQAKRVLIQTDWLYVGLSTIFFGGSLLAATLVYRALVGSKVKLWPALVVQTAGSFAGKIVPLGIGSISLSYLYLRKLRLTPGAAGSTVAANNLLGMVGHLCLVVLLLAIWPVENSRINLPASRYLLIGAVVLIVLGVFIAATRGSKLKGLRDFIAQLKDLLKRPRSLLVGLLFSMLITLCMAAALYSAALAAGVNISLTAALIVLSAGLLAQSATPTPGGLGGVEAGLTGGMLLVGVPLAGAIATTLLFRFVTYWLPLIVGGLALALAVRRHYVA